MEECELNDMFPPSSLLVGNEKDFIGLVHLAGKPKARLPLDRRAFGYGRRKLDEKNW